MVPSIPCLSSRDKFAQIAINDQWTPSGLGTLPLWWIPHLLGSDQESAIDQRKELDLLKEVIHVIVDWSVLWNLLISPSTGIIQFPTVDSEAPYQLT